jgi:hypothetical protein
MIIVLDESAVCEHDIDLILGGPHGAEQLLRAGTVWVERRTLPSCHEDGHHNHALKRISVAIRDQASRVVRLLLIDEPGACQPGY